MLQFALRHSLFRQRQKSLNYFSLEKLGVTSLHHSTLCTAHADVPFYCTICSVWRKSTNIGKWNYFRMVERIDQVGATYSIQHYSNIYKPKTQAVWELLVADLKSQIILCIFVAKVMIKPWWWNYMNKDDRKISVIFQISYSFWTTEMCVGAQVHEDNQNDLEHNIYVVCPGISKTCFPY
jgi:hypothetical protein